MLSFRNFIVYGILNVDLCYKCMDITSTTGLTLAQVVTPKVSVAVAESG